MAFTQTDLDAIRAAKATGALEVRYADGRQVRYRSLTEMDRIIQDIERSLAQASTTLASRRSVAGHVSGLS
jgi:hypothetical protein